MALLRQKIETMNFSAAADDVRPFMRQSEHLKLWETDYFLQVAGMLQLELRTGK